MDSYKHYKRFSYHKEEEMVVVVLGVRLGDGGDGGGGGRGVALHQLDIEANRRLP